MGRFIFWMIGGGMLWLMAACSEEVTTDDVQTGNEAVITFRLGVPPGDEIEYTRGNQEASEWEINRLKVYDFVIDVDTVLVGMQSLVKSDASGMPDVGSFTSNSGGGTARLSLPVDITGKKHAFAFVANETGLTHFDSIMQIKVSRIDELRKCPSNRRLKDGESCFALMENGPVMTGVTIENITGDLDCKVSLQRIMARLDVENNVPKSRNFRLKNIWIENCAPVSYLFGRDSKQQLTAKQWDYKKPVSQKQNLQVDMENGDLKKVLYLYEYLATSAKNIPTLYLRYTLNGAENTLSIPMVTDGGAKFDIRRNYLYTLVIGDVSAASTRLEYSLKEKGK